MTPLILFAALQATPAADPRLERCAALAQSDPAAARAEATRWQSEGGGFQARRCEGLSYAAENRWGAAADAFETAARAAELAKDSRAAELWAQAGNARLAGNDPAKARADLDAAIARGSLTGLALGEAYLDRARASVAADEPGAARADLDRALGFAREDPLAWLLSATLARRQGDLQRASADIAEALERAPDDASVRLEAGNIAAARRDEAGARAAWAEAVRLAPASPAGRAARAALAQFEPSPPKGAPGR